VALLLLWWRDARLGPLLLLPPLLLVRPNRLRVLVPPLEMLRSLRSEVWLAPALLVDKSQILTAVGVDGGWLQDGQQQREKEGESQ
jgi:hypothetical protein